MTNNAQTGSLVILTTIAVAVVLFFMKPILIPFLIAIMISYLLAPLTDKLAKYKVPRIISLLIIYILALVVFSQLIEILVNNVLSFTAQFPEYQAELITLLNNYTNKFPWLESAWADLSSWLFSLPIGSYTNSLVNSSIGFISNVFLILLFVTYLIITAPSLPGKIKKGFSGDKSKHILDIVDHINHDVRKYVNIHTLISLATGISTGLICWLIGVPFAFLWGVLAFMLNYIPTIGSIIATLPPLVTAAIVLGIGPAFWVGLLIIGVQMFWGNVVEPKIAGDVLGLSPLVILLSLVFWGWLWGIVGAILAVPIASIMKITCMNIKSLRPIGIFMDSK